MLRKVMTEKQMQEYANRKEGFIVELLYEYAMNLGYDAILEKSESGEEYYTFIRKVNILNPEQKEKKIMKKGNCYNQQVEAWDLVVAEDTAFDVTRNRVYVVRTHAGSNLIQIKNDKGVIQNYTTEYFRFYESEPIE